jgi:hypothetical protein
MVHTHVGTRSSKALLYIGFKPVMIQFYMNRCRTRRSRTGENPARSSGRIFCTRTQSAEWNLVDFKLGYLPLAVAFGLVEI